MNTVVMRDELYISNPVSRFDIHAYTDGFAESPFDSQPRIICDYISTKIHKISPQINNGLDGRASIGYRGNQNENASVGYIRRF